MWQGNKGDLKAPLLEGEENFVGGGSPSQRPSNGDKITDVSWVKKTSGPTPTPTSGGAGDAYWARNTAPPSPQKGSGGFLSKVLDVVVGPDLEHYGFVLGSLEESDERHVKQLTKTLPKDSPLPSTSNTRKVVFKKLESTGYEKSVVPFASDANPFGDIAALGVGLVVRDNVWGPDLLEEATDNDENYWQIIAAAQELALNVVFIFIRHKESAQLAPTEVCHPKFKKLAKGPWPQKQPYVFLMSYWGRFNAKQMEVMRMCMTITDPLQVKLAINKLVTKDVTSDSSSTQEGGGGGTSSKSIRDSGSGVWPTLFSSSDSVKGKEKVGRGGGGGGASSEEWKKFKKRLLKKNRKQMTLLMAAELHEMRERDKHVNKLESEVKELKALVANLQARLAATTPGEKEGTLI